MTTQRICVLENVHSMSAFYQQLMQFFDFPEYFSPNLDALYDVLSTDIEDEFAIHWKGQQYDKKLLGQTHFQAILRVLINLKKEREDFTLVLS